VHLGQDVILRFSGLDKRKTPELAGQVVRVSADAFREESTRTTYFRIKITLDEAQRQRLPEDVSLIPGMPVEAFIRTGDATPLAYLVKPLADYFARAFRD